jgi:hypothetical protein
MSFVRMDHLKSSADLAIDEMVVQQRRILDEAREINHKIQHCLKNEVPSELKIPSQREELSWILNFKSEKFEEDISCLR